MTKFSTDNTFLFAAANLPDEKIVGVFSLLLFCVFGFLFIAYIVWRLDDTSHDSIFFRFFFPSRRQRTVPWGIGLIVLALLIVVWCSITAQLVVSKIIPERIIFLDEMHAFDREEHDHAQREHATGDAPTDENVKMPEETAKPFSPDELSEQHQLGILMQTVGRYPGILILCFVMAVIVAPLSEEFLFRVIVQGGIEATLRREFGHSKWCRIVPILITALFFAAIHIRMPQKNIDEHFLDTLTKGFVAHIAGSLAAVAILLILLRKVWRIRWSDVGLWDFKRLPRDAAGAFVLLAIVLLPIYTVNFAVVAWAKRTGIPVSLTDPVPLLLFAMVLGTLYFRTRRLATVFFLHAFFNLCGFLALLYMTFYEIV